MATRVQMSRTASGAWQLQDKQHRYSWTVAPSEEHRRTWKLHADNDAAYRLLGSPERSLTFGRRIDARKHVEEILRDLEED